ncbi:hypothetical protein [Pelagibacterium halotolerans]|uniref:hypothetical protein n=1 Tax=Pelagibacterium halotolerans TaxID=531813 RepID=UPI00384B0B9E
MITRFALFEGRVRDGRTDAFRAAVLERLVPLWTGFPGNTDVAVTFSDECDDGAPEFPLILAISYPDRATMDAALMSPVRAKSKAETEAICAELFDGRIHHHVTQANRYPA